MVKVNVQPVSSEIILNFIIREMLSKDSFLTKECGEIRRLAKEAAGLLPEDYFPDTYIDIDLLGKDAPVLAIRLDNRECNLINYRTDGEYFTKSGMPVVISTEQYDRAAVMRLEGESRQSYEIEESAISLRHIPESSSKTYDPAAESLIKKLDELDLKTEVINKNGECIVTFSIGKRGPKNRFAKKKCADKVIEILEELGAPSEPLACLKGVSCNYGLPFYSQEYGYLQWVCSVDIAYFSVTFKEASASAFRVGIILTDKGADYQGGGIKPSQAYQWHITDNCDQRCKHCYLFAEDAYLKCVTTPWEMLIRILDECTLDAAARKSLPMLAVTGGDPVMHPRFWDLAEEIHRRGISWDMMGNPFHLSSEVCMRLRKCGVRKYQMSLDGLESFHDYMRKPGSYKATLEAVKWLNDAGIASQIMATVSRKNMDDIIALMDVVAEYNVFSFTFARYCATSPDKVEDYPSPEEYHRFLGRYYDKSIELKEKGVRTRYVQKEHLFTLLKWERGEFKVPESSLLHPDIVCDGCHLGRGVSILANGDVLACRRMESVLGNVWTTPLREIETSKERERYADVRQIKRCKDCELINWCRGCRAVGFNATGDLQAADPCCWKE